jgi:hypothetical protein
MKQSLPPPTVDDHPALIDWFIEHDPPFEEFHIYDEAMDRVRQDLLALLKSASNDPELLRGSIQDLIGFFARAVENANSGEMAGSSPPTCTPTPTSAASTKSTTSTSGASPSTRPHNAPPTPPARRHRPGPRSPNLRQR